MLYVKKELPTNATQEEMENYYIANEQKLRAIDMRAAKRGDKVHRVIKEQTKEGIALYQIVKYGLKNARVVFCEGISANEVPAFYWGKKALVSLEYIDVALIEHPAFPENNQYTKQDH